MRINIFNTNVLATILLIASTVMLFRPITHTFQTAMDKSEEALETNAYTETLFEEKLTDYKEIASQIPLNFNITLAFSLVGLVALFSRKHELEIPIANLSLPKKLAFAVLILGILYFWLDFGFTINRAIYARHSLEIIQKAVKSRQQLTTLHPMVSLYSVLEDNGFVDAWFVAYRGYLHNYGFPSEARYFAEGFLCGWGIIYGIFQGIMLVMAKHIFDREGQVLAPSFRRISIKSTCVLVLVIVIGFSHILFRFGGEQDGLSFQVSILISSLVSLWVLDYMVSVRLENMPKRVRVRNTAPSAPAADYAAK